MVKKRTNRKQQGVVDLNKARPGVNETSRPAVPKSKFNTTCTSDQNTCTNSSKY